MTVSFLDNLKRIQSSPVALQALGKLQRGLEKESLRVDQQGQLAQTAHPQTLGSALCHPRITTDYSESLLEFITPVHTCVSSCLQALNDIHRFTYASLNQSQEMLWQTSMPCPLKDAEYIPVAQYGSSNVAKMKTVYRLGLGLRYGRNMQAISGVHYNFSLNDSFWSNYQRLCGDTKALQDFKTEQYFGLIRNFQRSAPIFAYLFGASPALCKSFVQDNQHNLQTLDDHTLYSPYATSLRMGDLGYQSSAQQSLFVCYNSLDNYISSIRKAIKVPHSDYAAFGTHDADGQWHQLNTALLQIENEFYSIIRPKRVAASGEAPVNALARGGVEYIEIRCIDINPYAANGIDADTMRFLDMLLLSCLIKPSEQLNDVDCKNNYHNFKAVVSDGRDPDLTLAIKDEKVPFSTFANDVLDDLKPIAELLDSLHANDVYSQCLEQQYAKVADSSKTPSATMLATMQNENLSFFEFSQRQNQQWQQHFLAHPLSDNDRNMFFELAENSLAQQHAIEQTDTQSFESYLENFYQQY